MAIRLIKGRLDQLDGLGRERFITHSVTYGREADACPCDIQVRGRDISLAGQKKAPGPCSRGPIFGGRRDRSLKSDNTALQEMVPVSTSRQPVFVSDRWTIR